MSGRSERHARAVVAKREVSRPGVAVGFGIAALPIVLAAISIAPEFLFGVVMLVVLYGLLNALVDL